MDLERLKEIMESLQFSINVALLAGAPVTIDVTYADLFMELLEEKFDEMSNAEILQEVDNDKD